MAPPYAPSLAAWTALLAASSAASLPAALPLVGSCNVQTAQLSSNAWLGMYCSNANVASFAYNWTTINLDWCLANRAGHLTGRKLGNFHATCTHCSTRLRPTRRRPSLSASEAAGALLTDVHTLDLQCACLDARGRGVSTSFDLNHVLVDVDGALGCYGRLGNKTLAGPLATV